MKDINKFYKELLTDLGVVVDDDSDYSLLKPTKDGAFKRWRINVEEDGKTTKRAIFLPTQSNLDNPPPVNSIYFHPAGESTLMANSEILNSTILLVNAVITVAASVTLDKLLMAALSKETQVDLPTSVSKLVQKIGDISKTTYKEATNGGDGALLKKMAPRGKNALAVVKAHRHIEVNGETVKRAVELKVPVLDSDVIDEVISSNVGKESVTKAIELILGDTNLIRTSNSVTAPTFIALMDLFHTVMIKIKAIAEPLGAFKSLDLEYNGDWHSKLTKLHDWYRNDLYIQLTGNVGKTIDNDTKKQAEVSKPKRNVKRPKRHIVEDDVPAKVERPKRREIVEEPEYDDVEVDDYEDDYEDDAPSNKLPKVVISRGDHLRRPGPQRTRAPANRRPQPRRESRSRRPPPRRDERPRRPPPRRREPEYDDYYDDYYDDGYERDYREPRRRPPQGGRGRGRDDGRYRDDRYRSGPPGRTPPPGC